MIWSRWVSFDKTWVSDGEVNDYRRRAWTLSEVAAWGDGQVNLTGDGDPERVSAAPVTANLFSTLGVVADPRPNVHGAEDVPNGPNVVVSATACGSGATPAIRQSSADRSRSTARRIEVIGIMPADSCCRQTSRIPRRPRCGCRCGWDRASTEHGNHGYYAAARLKPGATVAQAQDEMHADRAGDDE